MCADTEFMRNKKKINNKRCSKPMIGLG